MVEIGATTTRAVVAEPSSDGELTLRLDRRIVLRPGRAVERDGARGEGRRLLAAGTVRRPQAERFRAGVASPHVVVAADLAGSNCALARSPGPGAASPAGPRGSSRRAHRGGSPRWATAGRS